MTSTYVFALTGSLTSGAKQPNTSVPSLSLPSGILCGPVWTLSIAYRTLCFVLLGSSSFSWQTEHATLMAFSCLLKPYCERPQAKEMKQKRKVCCKFGVLQEEACLSIFRPSCFLKKLFSAVVLSEWFHALVDNWGTTAFCFSNTFKRYLLAGCHYFKATAYKGIVSGYNSRRSLMYADTWLGEFSETREIQGLLVNIVLLKPNNKVKQGIWREQY